MYFANPINREFSLSLFFGAGELLFVTDVTDEAFLFQLRVRVVRYKSLTNKVRGGTVDMNHLLA